MKPNHTPIKIKHVRSKRSAGCMSAVLHNKRLILYSVIMVGIVIVATPLIWILQPLRFPVEAAWYDSTWSYRKAIVIDADKVPGTSNLTNFPVLIRITDPEIARSAQSNGNDIMFTSSDGSTKINHEIESYNSARGELIAWVNVPTISYNNDTTIYLYYGNATATNQQSVTATWNSNYVGIFHLKESGNGTAGEFDDSTAEANDGRGGGGTSAYVPARVSGKIGYGQSFDGTNDYISVADDASLDFTASEDYAISFWIRGTETPATGTWPGIVSKFDSSTNGFTVGISNELQDNFFMNQWSGSNWRGAITGPDINNGSWFYVVVGRSGTTLFQYTNGSNFGSTAIVSYDLSNAIEMLIGCRVTGPNDCVSADLDELRIMNTPPTANWVATEYANQSDPDSFYTISRQQSQSDPVLYWKFDEANGTTANDSSSYSNTGIITPGRWVTSGDCPSGSCIQIDGASGSISRTYASDSELDPGTGSFAVSTWVKHTLNAPDTAEAIVMRYSDAGFIVSMTTTGTVCFGIDDDNTWGPDDSACTTATYLDNRWHHITAVKEGTSAIRLYVDGTLTAEDTSLSATGSLSGTSPAFSVGGSAGGGGPELNSWTGFIDETKFFNYSLNTAQIYAQMVPGSDAGTAVSAGSKVATQSFGGISNGQLVYCPMNEVSANTCAGGTNDTCDQSGNGFDGAWTGNAGSTGIARYGLGTTYDGTGDYIAIADSAVLRPGSGPYTVSFWANPPDSNQTDYFFSKAQSSGDTEQITIGMCGAIDCASTGQNLYVSFRQSESIERRFLSSADIADGNWHMFTVVIDPVSQQILAYRDGVLLSAGSTVSDGAWPVVDNTDGIRIGSSSLGGDYAGQLDELRVYNRALSQQEIISLYTWAPQPAAYWKFDENIGTSVFDIGGNSLTGTFDGTPDWILGKFGGALQFNGTNESVTIPDNAVLNPESGSWSLMLWARPANTNQNSILAGKVQLNTPYEQYSLAVCGDISCNTSGQLLVARGIQSSGTSDRRAISTGDIADGNWHHYAVVADRAANTVNLYMDGKLLPSTSSSNGSWPTINNPDDFMIGAADGTAYFNGPIDDVKFYNYARSAAQIIEDYNAGHPAPGSPISSAMGHWKLDENQGTTAFNAGNSGSILNGTMSNFALPATSTSGWTRSGKIGSALIFDGNNDIVNLGSDSTIDNLNPITVSAWIYPTGWGEGNFGHIVSKENTSTVFGFTLVNNTGQNTFRIYRERATSPVQATAASGSITLNTWQHVAGIIDTTNNIVRLYLNGKEVASYIDQTMGSGSVNSDAANNLNIGNRTAGDRTFAGTIDEVKVFNSVLTADQIALLYNQSSTAVYGAVSTESDGKTPSFNQNRAYCIPGDTSSCTPPVAEWKFDENTGTSVADTTGNNNTATFQNSPTWVRGKFGSGLSLNGTNAYLRVSTMTGLSNTTGTISAWVYPTVSSPSTDEMIVMGNRDTNRIYLLRKQTTGNLALRLGSLASTDTGVNIPTNTWSYVGMSWNSGNYTMYMNGKPVSTGTYSDLNSPLNGYSIIGAYDDLSGTVNSYFAGIIDQVTIFNYARTPAQIAWDYNRGAPFAHWKFDECTGDTIYDASGNSHNGTLSYSGGADYTSSGTCTSGNAAHARYAGAAGKFGAAIAYDGPGMTISAPVTASVRGLSQYSISLWVKPLSLPTSGNAHQYYFEAVNDNGFTRAGIFALNNSYGASGLKFGFLFRTGDGSSSRRDVPGTVTTPVTGQWYHVVGVFDSINDQHAIYVNGKLDGSSTTAETAVADTAPSTTIRMGASSSDSYSTSILDDVRVYSYALTPRQVEIIMNEGSALRFGPQ
ncbi:MAG: DUF2341 domain-containing protein [Patescibacteria group bacterium]|nr:DUF2341 domain-containing protein [Patescibacteria group bacterium]